MGARGLGSLNGLSPISAGIIELFCSVCRVNTVFLAHYLT